MDKITTYGKIEFEPLNKTKKHELQASWKRIAMILIDGDIAEYYAWFIKKRYSLALIKPLRGAHITFINDRGSDMTLKEWEEVKTKWDGKEIEVSLDVDPRTDDKHWWLNVPHEDREQIHGIRAELGLGKPYFGLHMSLGYANDRMIDHSTYIHRLIKNGFIN